MEEKPPVFLSYQFNVLFPHLYSHLYTLLIPKKPGRTVNGDVFFFFQSNSFSGVTFLKV